MIDTFEAEDAGEVNSSSSSNNDCIFLPREQYGSRWVSTSAVDIPHGELVAEQIRQSIQVDGGSQVDEISNGLPDWMPGIELWEVEFGFVVLVKVNVDTGFTAQAIKERTDKAIDILDEVTGGEQYPSIELADGVILENIDKFVMNMSFAIVPCNLEEFIDSEYVVGYLMEVCGTEETRDLLEALVSESDEFQNSTICDRFIGDDGEIDIQAILDMLPLFAYHYGYRPTRDYFIDSDLGGLLGANKPFLRVLQNNNNKIIRVAAAGNFGWVPIISMNDLLESWREGLQNIGREDLINDSPLVFGFDYPFAPGLSPGVLSVSAELGTTPYLTNPGEVAANGRLVLPSGMVDANGTQVGRPGGIWLIIRRPSRQLSIGVVPARE